MLGDPRLLVEGLVVAIHIQQQWQAEAQAPRSNTLGLVGFGLVALCTVVLAIVGYLLGQSTGQFMADYGMDPNAMPDTTDPMVIAFGQSISGLSWALTGSVLFGIVGWIISIVATSRRQGRSFGIWGIVLGIAAPVIGFIAMVMGMWPFVAAVAG